MNTVNLTDAFSVYERALFTGDLNTEMSQKLTARGDWKITLKITQDDETDTFTLTSGSNAYGPVMTLKALHITPEVFHLTSAEYEALKTEMTQFFITSLNN
jgi:hypothetical protein